MFGWVTWIPAFAGMTAKAFAGMTAKRLPSLMPKRTVLVAIVSATVTIIVLANAGK